MSGTPSVPTAGLTLSPPSIHYHGKPVTVRLWNSGSTPIHVHAEALLLKGDCAQSLVKGMKISPDDFRLAPRQQIAVKITVPGHVGDYGGLFVQQPPAGQKGVTVNRALGVQIYQGSGTHTCIAAHTPRKVTATPVSHTADWMLPAAIGFAALVAVIITTIVLIRGRGR